MNFMYMPAGRSKRDVGPQRRNACEHAFPVFAGLIVMAFKVCVFLHTYLHTPTYIETAHHAVIIQWHFGPATPEKFHQGLRSSAADSPNFGAVLSCSVPSPDTSTRMSHLCTDSGVESRPTSAHPIHGPPWAISDQNHFPSSLPPTRPFHFVLLPVLCYLS